MGLFRGIYLRKPIDVPRVQRSEWSVIQGYMEGVIRQYMGWGVREVI